MCTEGVSGAIAHFVGSIASDSPSAEGEISAKQYPQMN